jgi:hypothetical protein
MASILVYGMLHAASTHMAGMLFECINISRKLTLIVKACMEFSFTDRSQINVVVL